MGIRVRSGKLDPPPLATGLERLRGTAHFDCCGVAHCAVLFFRGTGITPKVPSKMRTLPSHPGRPCNLLFLHGGVAQRFISDTMLRHWGTSL